MTSLKSNLIHHAHLRVRYVPSLHTEVVLAVSRHVHWEQQLVSYAVHLSGSDVFERRDDAGRRYINIL